MEPIRVALVNDFQLVVQGLAALLAGEEGIEVVELATSERVSCRVDVALYDTFGALAMEEAASRRVLSHPQIGAVIAYTSRLSSAWVDEFLGLGGRGVLPKSLGGPELADAIRRVHAGEVVVHPEQGRAPSLGSWPGQAFGLTERESDTLALLATGLENDEIAAHQYVSVNTVKTHLRAIYRKIPADNRVRAALWAHRNGFTADRFTEGQGGADRR